MTRQTLLLWVLAAGFVTVPLHAQEATPQFKPVADPAPSDASLKPVFDQFGGKVGLAAVVDDFMANNLANPRTRRFFTDIDRAHVKAQLVDQFCVILGGPCTYTGKNMEQVHRDLNIHRSEFDALVENLQKAMDKHDIPFRAQNKLLAKLAPMHREIVTK